MFSVSHCLTHDTHTKKVCANRFFVSIRIWNWVYLQFTVTIVNGTSAKKKKVSDRKKADQSHISHHKTLPQKMYSPPEWISHWSTVPFGLAIRFSCSGRIFFMHTYWNWLAENCAAQSQWTILINVFFFFFLPTKWWTWNHYTRCFFFVRSKMFTKIQMGFIL